MQTNVSFPPIYVFMCLNIRLLALVTRFLYSPVWNSREPRDFSSEITSAFVLSFCDGI